MGCHLGVGGLKVPKTSSKIYFYFVVLASSHLFFCHNAAFSADVIVAEEAVQPIVAYQVSTHVGDRFLAPNVSKN